MAIESTASGHVLRFKLWKTKSKSFLDIVIGEIPIELRVLNCSRVRSVAPLILILTKKVLHRVLFGMFFVFLSITCLS